MIGDPNEDPLRGTVPDLDDYDRPLHRVSAGPPLKISSGDKPGTPWHRESAETFASSGDDTGQEKPLKIEWGKISLGVTRTCPHCQQEYEDNGYGGHILTVFSTEGEYRTCLTLLMRTLHSRLPGTFQFTPKVNP